jgi:DNA-binding SARP family transcriptional activator
LIDALWADHPPTSARKSVQNQIARLRQNFGTDVIITTGDRYRLGATTDIDLFDQLEVHADRPVLTSTEEARFANALAAWSGEPYAELAEIPLAQAERARLVHTRARLIETLAISRLSRWTTTGVECTTIVDLTVRASTHPLHERAWELLVAALHLSGRRTEALGTYESFRLILGQQLGVEPSPDFKRLRSVVDADHLLGTAATGGSTPKPMRHTPSSSKTASTGRSSAVARSGNDRYPPAAKNVRAACSAGRVGSAPADGMASLVRRTRAN